MKYKERDELVADLRELADLLEERGHKLPIDRYSPFMLCQYFYGDPAKEQMVRVAKNIGKAQKDYSDSYFKITRMMKNNQVGIKFDTPRENVCTPKVVGTEKKPKMRFVEIPGEFDEKEIIEWECTDSLLAEDS